MLVTNNLTKYYGPNRACGQICLSIGEGQVFGLLGPNGAGKSTLVKMLLGLVHPSSGQATIMGKPVRDKNVKKHIGYLPELFRLYEWLRAEELLRFNSRLYEIPISEEKQAISCALELVGLKGREREKIQAYSKGMQQRLALAAAILHKPRLLFLDEPTSALDPIGRREIRDIINDLHRTGTTIFLNSHLLGEVEMTCSHLGFIKKGKLIASGRMEDFQPSQEEIEITADNIDPALLSNWEARGMLITCENDKMLLRTEGRDAIPGLVEEMVSHGARVYRVSSHRRGLEDVFMDLIEGGE